MNFDYNSIDSNARDSVFRESIHYSRPEYSVLRCEDTLDFPCVSPCGFLFPPCSQRGSAEQGGEKKKQASHPSPRGILL